MTQLCECCQTNPKKTPQAKYCPACSEYVCELILSRTHRIDARYKKIFRTLHRKLHSLAEEDHFLPNSLKEFVEDQK